jgi:hypothetical protein
MKIRFTVKFLEEGKVEVTANNSKKERLVVPVEEFENMFEETDEKGIYAPKQKALEAADELGEDVNKIVVISFMRPDSLATMASLGKAMDTFCKKWNCSVLEAIVLVKKQREKFIRDLEAAGGSYVGHEHNHHEGCIHEQIEEEKPREEMKETSTIGEILVAKKKNRNNK